MQYHGHIVDNCYKIHGYPPGFKHRWSNSNRSTGVSANPGSHNSSVGNRSTGVSTNQISGSHNSFVGHSSGDAGSNLSQSFSKDQMEQLRVMFTQHLSSFENQHNSGADSKMLISQVFVSSCMILVT